MEKNQIFQTVIEDMSDKGEGIGRVDGYTLFIKDTVIGDRIEGKVVKAGKRYGFGRLVRVLEPSPCRVTPRCPAAAPCGGCQLQAMSYESQLRFKENKVRNHLTRIGGFDEADCPVAPVLGMEGDPFRYRNKGQFPFGRAKDGRIIYGFYAGRTHSIIEAEDCLLGAPVSRRILETVREFMEEFGIDPYDETAHQGLVRHVLIRTGYETGEIMVCLVVNGTGLPHSRQLVRRLTAIEGMTSISLNLNRKKTNVILGEEMVWLAGERYITDRIGPLTYRISPQSFFQVNPLQTRKLYETALEFAGTDGQRDCMGPVLRNRDDLPVSGAEGGKSIRRGDRARRHRERQGKCQNKRDRQRGVLCGKIGGNPASVVPGPSEREGRCHCGGSAQKGLR